MGSWEAATTFERPAAEGPAPAWWPGEWDRPAEFVRVESVAELDEGAEPGTVGQVHEWTGGFGSSVAATYLKGEDGWHLCKAAVLTTSEEARADGTVAHRARVLVLGAEDRVSWPELADAPFEHPGAARGESGDWACPRCGAVTGDAGLLGEVPCARPR